VLWCQVYGEQSTVAEIWRFLNFSKMATVRHLGFVMPCLNHSRRAFSGLYHCAKFDYNRCRNVNNMQVLIFHELGLKTPIHAIEIVFWGGGI